MQMAKKPSRSRFAPILSQIDSRARVRKPEILPFGAMIFGALLPAMSPGLAGAQTPSSASSASSASSGSTGSSGPSSSAGRAGGAKDAPEVTLPAVEVKDAREQQSSGYQGGKTTIGKTSQLPKDIPQSVTLVTEQLMKDRAADTFREALRNVAGLTFNAGEGGRIGDNITLRGYSAVGDLYLDGLRDIAQYNRETFNLHQIDILRGSASMLFGRGSTGGVINQVSKTPFPGNRNDVALTLGSNHYKRAVADLNRAIGDNVSMRINLMKTDADSDRDGVEQSRWGVAPSLRFGAYTNDDVTLSYYYLKEHNIPDYGVPYFEGRPLNVPVNRFYGLANADYERNATGIATATHVHKWNEDTSLKTVLRQAGYARDLRATAPRLVGAPATITDGTLVNRQRQARGADENTWTLQSDFTTKAKTGRLEHELVAGFEYVHEKSHRWTNSSALVNPTTTVGNPNPNPLLPAGFDESFSRTADNHYKARTYGLYAQDVVAVAPAWKVALGARWDDFSADYDRPLADGGPLARRDRVWSTRGGVMFQPRDDVTYYVSYGTSFNPSAELYQLDARAVNTPPEKGRNVEAGIKWELFDGDLSLRTALFRSEKTNERNTDLSVSVERNLLSGKRHTDGIEVEATGQITPNWLVFGAVAAMNAKIDEATGQQLNTLGRVPVNTPKHTYALWTTYALGGGWKIGGGVDGAGLRYGQNANTTAAPPYARWDALIEYDAKLYTVKLNALNLFDRDYYEGVYAGHVIPGVKRSFQVTLSSRF